MINKTLLTILVLIALSTPALATDYYVSIQLDTIIQNTDGTKAWSTPIKYNMNLTESISSLGVTVNFYDLQQSAPLTALFRITGGSISDVPLQKAQATCVKGQCRTNDMPNATTGDVRLTVMDIIQKTVSTTVVNTTSDNPIYAYYIDYDKEVPLKKNGVKAFDVAGSSRRDEGDDALDEVEVYFKRQSNIPVSVTVSGGTEDPAYDWNTDRIRYIIDEAGTFIFTVKYDKLNPWGANDEQTDTYTLTISGLASKNTVAAIGTYDILLTDTKIIEMTQPGSFEPQASVTITPQGNNKFAFKFDALGNYRVKYKADGGSETFVEFNVKQPADSQATPAPDTTDVSANQVQDDGTGNSGGNNLYYFGIVLLVVGGIVFYLKSRKKTFGGKTEYKPQ